MKLAFALAAVAAVGIWLLGRAVRVNVHVSTRIVTRDLREFSRAFRQRVQEHMRSSYSGDPTGLERALRGLVPIAHALAAERGIELDDRSLRLLIAGIVTAERLAPRRDVSAALDAILPAEKLAA